MWCLSHSAPTHSPQTLHVFFLSLRFFLSFVCLPAFLSLSLCLHPDHSSTSLSLSLPVTHSPPQHYALLGQSRLLAHASWRACLRVIAVIADAHHHTCLICRRWTESTLTSEGQGQRQRREQVDSHSMTMPLCRQRDIHNWWSSFAALSHWRAPIVQHVGTWTSGAVNLCS